MVEMRSSQGQIGPDDDAAPVDMLASLFEARGWPYEYSGEDEISGEVQGSWASYQLRGIWRAADHVLQLLCLPDVRVPDTKRRAMFELLAKYKVVPDNKGIDDALAKFVHPEFVQKVLSAK